MSVGNLPGKPWTQCFLSLLETVWWQWPVLQPCGLDGALFQLQLRFLSFPFHELVFSFCETFFLEELPVPVSNPCPSPSPVIIGKRLDSIDVILLTVGLCWPTGSWRVKQSKAKIIPQHCPCLLHFGYYWLINSISVVKWRCALLPSPSRFPFPKAFNGNSNGILCSHPFPLVKSKVCQVIFSTCLDLIEF